MDARHHGPEHDASATGGSARHIEVPGKGFRIGEYVIQKTLGHGSMATVYLAQDSTGHDVALKMFQEGPGVSATMLERFRREAEAAKKLRRHPNIMKVYSTGHEGPFHYIVMEPIHHSKTLDDIIANNTMTKEEIVGVIIKIARALQFAHSRNIVHRDVKPTNIMIDEFGEPLLTDFGVAALIDWPTCTITGALTGTPLYMSPEQARAEAVGPETDVYSLAVVLYEALTGVLPYSAQHAAPIKSVLEAVKNELPKRPRAHRKDISPDLEAVMMKALEKDPHDRYADADAFADDLERALAGRHVSARLFTFRDRLLFIIRRHEKGIAAGLLILALISLVLWFSTRRVLEARYETLMTFAQLRSFALRMAQSEQADPTIRHQGGAWPELRMARRAMTNGKWNNAEPHLESAISYCQSIGDTRTRALAELDLARLRWINGEYDAANRLYQEVMNNPDASPPVIYHAILDALMLNLLLDKRDDVVRLVSLEQIASETLFRNAVLCLTGEIPVERYSEQIIYLPRRLQNDAHLAVAIRMKINGDSKGYVQELRQVIQKSTPATEWPAPVARQLYEKARL